MAPTAMLLPQWRGLADPDNSAFAIEQDPINDINLVFKVLDLDSAGLQSDLDYGTICTTRLYARRWNIHELWDQQDQPVFAPAMQSNRFSPADFSQEQDLFETASTGHIRDGAAHYRLTPGYDEIGSRKTLLPFDQTIQGSFNQQLYPIEWTTDRLYLFESQGMAEGTDDTDPCDLVEFIGFVPTIEVLGVHLVLRGFRGWPHNHMYRAGSLRLPSAVDGAVQRYVAFYHTQNRTAVASDDAARLGPRITFSNHGNIIGTAADGQGRFAVTALKAWALRNP